jgi:pyruvate carboxylase
MSVESRLPFFVYGTLMFDSGQPNTHHWLGATERHEPAVLANACLFAFPSFPMMLLDDSSPSQVRGQVVWLQIDRYDEVLRSLDALEEFDPAQPDSSLYIRTRVNVQLQDGSTVEAFTYVAKAATDVKDLPRIEGDDWVEFCKREPARLDWWHEQSRSGTDVREQVNSTPTAQ